MKQSALLEIMDALDIEVIHLSNRGWTTSHCPFAPYLHNSGRDRMPDFHAKVEPDGISGFQCFACKQHGRISTLVRLLERFREEDYAGLDIRADLADICESFDEWGARKFSDFDPEPLDKAAYLTIYGPAWEWPDARAYLEDRQISEATAELLTLQYDEEECRILFPVFDYKTELYGFSGRSILSEEEIVAINSRRKFGQYPKVRDYAGLRKEKMLLGEQFIDRTKSMWIVEGLFALAHMFELGVSQHVNVLATLGASMSDYQRDVLAGHNRPVWLVYDADEAGDKGILGELRADGTRAENGAYKKLSGHVPVFIPFWPPGVTDPDMLTLENVLEMLDGDTYVPE